jgi:hypothetical protein
VVSEKWAWLRDLRFLQLTLFIIFFLFTVPLLGQEWLLRLFSNIFLLNALLVSLSADGKAVRLKWLLWPLFGIVTGLTVFYLSPLAEPANRLIFLRLAIGCDMLLLIICLYAIFSFIFQSLEVTLDTIFAAVVAYLFIAFAFAQAYMLLNSVIPQSFNLAAPVDPASYRLFQDDLIYYSLIVITTVGIGDIIPLNPAARALTVIEAMTGQFFVAIMVAWLVGRFLSQSQSDPPNRHNLD